MNEIASLLLWLAPLTLLAMISPVVFLNASTVAAHRGPRGRWQFVAGNALVLIVLGTLSMGLLGVAAEQLAMRELSSRWVDWAMGGLLLLLAISLWRGILKDRARHRAGEVTTVQQQPSLPRSLGGWGALGMVTNLTTVALYVAMAQRIGVSAVSLALRIIVLLVVTVLVLLPAWAPMVLASLLPERATLSAATLRRLLSWTRGFSLIATLVGAVYLMVHAMLV